MKWFVSLKVTDKKETYSESGYVNATSKEEAEHLGVEMLMEGHEKTPDIEVEVMFCHESYVTSPFRPGEQTRRDSPWKKRDSFISNDRIIRL